MFTHIWMISGSEFRRFGNRLSREQFAERRACLRSGPFHTAPILPSTIPTMAVRNTLVSNNTAFGGGGIFVAQGTLFLTDSPIRGNSAATGGGLFNDLRGKAVVTSSPITRNSASVDGGGVANS